MKVTASIPLRDDTDPIDSERSVSRMTLRQVLFTGMEDVVQFDKTFTHYDQHEGSFARVADSLAQNGTSRSDPAPQAGDRACPPGVQPELLPCG